MLWMTLTFTALLVACESPPPPPPRGDVIGNVQVGQPLPNGFTCSGARCEKLGEVASRSGTIIASTCGDVVYRVSFQGTFLHPESVAEQLRVPSKADGIDWLKQILDALGVAGFIQRKVTDQEREDLRGLYGGQQFASNGTPLSAPEFSYFDHPDGRHRILMLLHIPAGAAAAALDPGASVLEFTIGTIAESPCTSGI